MSNVTTFKSEGYFVGLGAPSANMFIPAGALYVDRETGVAYTFSDGNWNPIGGGGGSLPLQVDADGDAVLLNAASDVVLSVDSYGQALLKATSGNQIGFGPSGYTMFLDSIGNTVADISPNGDFNFFGKNSFPDQSLFYVLPPATFDSNGTAASLTTDLGVPNADLTWTASSVGQAGNSLQVEYVDPGTPSASLSASYAAPVLTINLATGPAVGPIDTSHVGSGGSGWSMGDTAVVVNSAQAGDITAVNQGTKTFTLDVAINPANTYLIVTGTNAGLYTVDTISGNDVTVNEAIPSATVDGGGFSGSATLTVDTVTVDAIATYTVDAAGVEYVVGTMDLVKITGSGVGATLVIDTIAAAAPITTTAQDIIDLGSYDSAPVTVATAPANDGSGIVIALSATNLSGGLAALNVTGPSSLDNGAITTNGSGGLSPQSLSSVGTVRAGETLQNQLLVIGGASPGDHVALQSEGDDTDVSLDINAQGAGTINLNSPVLASALPTSDPAVAGALWVDPAGGLYIVKVSQG